MAMILQPFVGRYLNQLADFVEGEACMVLGVKDDLRRLQRRLERLRSVLADAERKRIEDEAIKTWVMELKDVMYDADDIFDLCVVEGSRLLRGDDDHLPASTETDHPTSVCSPFPLLFSCFSATKFRYEIGKRIKSLNGRLKEIAEDTSILSRLNTSASRDAPTTVNTRQTSPLLDNNIVGEEIEHATQRLVMSIIREEEHNNNCRVFGIVGMGGIGKTTLARKIFNDGTVSNMFAPQIWVCISQNFNEEDVLQQMIRGAGGSYGNATTRSELEPMLASVLSAKSFFVVLDDVWRADVWENLLRIPLESGAARGRVLVTTRDEAIARSMGASIHRVGKMNDSDGWVFLRKMVFGDVGEDKAVGFGDVGAQIVKKCDGLPLAIKVIAGVLRSKEMRIAEWENLLRSDTWSMSHLPEELRGALYLSYENLPPDLKQCFLSFSLYPEDFAFRRDDLVRYWVDEGLIRAQRGDVLMEQVAEDYFKELIARNLLQPLDPSPVDVIADVRACSMHDLVHSLALFLIGGESVCLDKDAQRLLSPSPAYASPLTKLRHMFISDVEEGSVVLNQIKMKKEQACLRTLIIYDSPHLHMLEDGLFERLARLRVLNLQNTGLERLPESVGKLIHLRQLNLENTGIEMLPETIGDLVNLQSLNLRKCKSLHRLPNGIVRLRNLRSLRIYESPVSHMPKGIGQLKYLNELDGFIVGTDATSSSEQVAPEGCKMTELQSLTQLRKLSITHLERATTRWNSSLANKVFLYELELSFSVEGADAHTQERILEGVSLPPNLQRLGLSGFAGRRFPTWILSPSPRNSFQRLEILYIVNCPACLQLPPLAQLPELRSLSIMTVNSIASIGCEFIGHNRTSAAFPKLVFLIFSDMYSWEQWSLDVGEEKSGDGGRLLPRLRSLYIIRCPMLRSLPEGLQLATSLKKIFIEDADSLQEIKNLPLTERLKLTHCSCLERLSDLPNLESIEISACPNLKEVVNLDSLHHINLTLQSMADPIDQTTERLPEWIGGLVQQRQQKEAHSSAPSTSLVLRMTCSSHLLKRCIEGGPDWHIIRQISRVHITGFDGSGLSLWYTRTPPSYNYTGEIIQIPS